MNERFADWVALEQVVDDLTANDAAVHWGCEGQARQALRKGSRNVRREVTGKTNMREGPRV